MKKILLSLGFALLSSLAVQAQNNNSGEKFKPRFSVGASIYGTQYLGKFSFEVSVPPGAPPVNFEFFTGGLSGFVSFDAQLTPHSGVELNVGAGAGSYLENSPIFALSYKFYSRIVNFNVGGMAAFPNSDNFSSKHNYLGLLLRVSKDITIYRSFYCEPFIGVDFMMQENDKAFNQISAGVALKYRF